VDDDAGNDTTPEITDGSSMACRLFRKAVQQGRSERRGEIVLCAYVEPLSDARTMLADFVNSLQVEFSMSWAGKDLFGISCEKFGSAKLESSNNSSMTMKREKATATYSESILDSLASEEYRIAVGGA
jgi:hypothetical protein